MPIQTRKIALILWRSTLVLLLMLAIAIFGGYYYLNTAPGRRWLTERTTRELNKLLGVPVSLGGAEISFPGRLKLHDLRVLDHHDSLMISVRETEVAFGYYGSTTGRIALDELTLDSMKFRLHKYRNEETTNFNLVIRRLRGTDTTTGTTRTDFIINSVRISHMDFDFNDEDEHYVTDKIDFDHVQLRDGNAVLTQFALDGPNIYANLKTVNVKERTGFVVSDMHTRFSYTPKRMEFGNLYILTPYSEIQEYLRFDYDDIDDFNKFYGHVKMTGRLENSVVSFRDLSHFTSDLENKTDLVQVRHANVTGTVDNMKIREADLSFGNRSFLRAKVELKGLPNLGETFILARIDEARTSEPELNRLLPELHVPAVVGRFGSMHFHGNFAGFFKDFVADGSFKTDIGDFVTDLNLKLADDPAKSSYSGKLVTRNLNLGTLVNEPQLGLLSMNGKIRGSGFTPESMNADMTAEFSRLDFRGYPYQALKVNGKLAQQLFDGKLNAADPNLNLDFAGTVNFNKAKPEFAFTSDVRNADLYALGFAHDSLRIASHLTINARGMDVDALEGNIIARNTMVDAGSQTYSFDSLNLVSIIEDHYREMNIYSDLALARVRGDFRPSDLPDLVKSTLGRYVDTSFVQLSSRKVKDQHVDFDIFFQDLSLVFDLLNTNVRMEDSGFVSGSIRANDGYVKLHSRVPGFTLNGTRYRDLSLIGNSNSAGNSLDLDFRMASITRRDSAKRRDSVYVQDVHLLAKLNNDRTRFDLKAATAHNESKVNLVGGLDVYRSRALLQLDTSMLFVKGNTWKIDARQITLYGDTMVEIPLLSLSNGNQRVKFMGNFSSRYDYPIRIISENMNLENIAAFVPQINGFQGELNGQVRVEKLKTNPIVEAGFYVSPFAYKNDTLGTLSATSQYDQSTRQVSIDARLENKKLEEVLLASGTIGMDQRQALDLRLALNNTEIRIFEPFLEGVFSKLRGTANANIRVAGTVDKPDITGQISLNNDTLTVDYLQTRYSFSDVVNIKGNVIDLGAITLKDVKGNTAELSGTMTLKRLDELVLNLKIDASDGPFQVMNTTHKSSELYYGEIYATGRVYITGPTSDVAIKANVTTAPNSVFYLQVNQSNTFISHDFIKFTDTATYGKRKHLANLEGITVDLDITATRDAKAFIIFDPRIGDVIEGNGYGNLHMNVSAQGDFTMTGVYNISQGSYLFTAYDVINKNFSITPGSTISWTTGNPFEATLNVTAVYTVNSVSLANLQVNASTVPVQDNRYATVDAKLKLTGSLLSPDIYLDFDVRQQGTLGANYSDITHMVNIIKADEQERNKQVVSLLVMQSFAPANTGINAGNAVGSTLNTGLGDLVSNQINYWLSQITEDVHLGVNMGPNEDFILRLNTSLFNGKVLLNGNFDLSTANRNVTVEVPLTPTVRTTAFNRATSTGVGNSPGTFPSNTNTFGVGISFRKQFDKLNELYFWRKKKNKKKDAAPAAPAPANTPAPAQAGPKKPI